MTLQIQSPYIHVSDSNGIPYVGATLAVYLPGTTTYADIYSDDGLSVALPNPLRGIYASNAAGNFPRAYIASGTYKLRAETSAGVLIFEEDDVDTGLAAGTGALPISRGGTGATTAAAARSNLDVPSNSELTALSTQIATLTTALQGIVAAPQGYLTLTSGTPVIASDVTAATAVYYTPFTGGLVPIYDGTQFNPVSFSELTLTLNSNHLASTMYDVFVAKSSGVAIIGTGPAWNSSSMGAGSRGTGGGTTELERVSGMWVNKNAITLRNGATLYSIGARQATFVGSIYMDGTNGQITCHRSIGQSRKWGVSNAWNRVPITLVAADSTASWSYTTATIRAANNSALNCLDIFSCLPEEPFEISYAQIVQVELGSTASAVVATIGIGYNSTTAYSGRYGTVGGHANSSTSGTSSVPTADLIQAPITGGSRITALETGASGASAATFIGTSSAMALKARWRG
jgi:hypothetical protein